MRSKGWLVGAWMWLVFAIISTGCVGCASGGMRAGTPKVPDTTGIIRMIGRFSIGSGCPVGPRKIVTNAHMTDPRPFDLSAPTVPYQFEQGTRLGVAIPEGVSNYRDISIMRVKEDQPDLAMWYDLAEVGPRDGDTVYFMAYDWRDKERAFAPRLMTSRVLRTVAGHIIYDPAGAPGSSGSCVLNEAGLVVGINAFSRQVGMLGNEVGGAVLYIKGLE